MGVDSAENVWFYVEQRGGGGGGEEEQGCGAAGSAERILVRQ